jgi:type IV pilus biogenesis protein PilP
MFRFIQYLALVCLLTMHQALAVTPVVNNAQAFSELQIQSAQSKLQLEIAQTELSKLKIDQKIDDIKGVDGSQASGSLKLHVLQIASFNGKALAVIRFNNKTRNYHQGDRLTGNFQISDITPNSVTLKNLKTNEESQYFIA